MKFMGLILMCCAIAFSLIGCNDKKRNSQNDINTIGTEHTTGEEVETSSSYNTKTDIIKLKIQLEDTVKLKHELKHIDSIYIDLEQFDSKELPSLLDETNFSLINCIKNKIISECTSNDSINTEKLGLIDPYNNTYQEIEDIPFSAAYGDYSFVLQNKYFIMISCVEDSDKFLGNVKIYDIDTNELKFTDSFESNNIVQFITPVGESGIAYSYYEYQTQDWIVIYYDINTNNSTEIFRHTNFNDITVSPMAITSDGEDVVFVIQFEEDGFYHTHLAWITTDGNWYKTEEIDLYNVYGNNLYEISNFIIDEDYYFINVRTEENVDGKYIIFYRENNVLHPISSAIFKTNELLSSSLSDKTNITFRSNSEVGIELININLIDKTMTNYKTSVTPYDEVKDVLINEQGDLFILYSIIEDETIKYTYQVVEDFNSINETAKDYALYENVYDLYDKYLDSDNVTPEGIKEYEKIIKIYEESVNPPL